MNLFIRHDQVKGRGVFCDRDIPPGQVIEVCELLFLKMKEISDSLEGYVYYYSKTMAALALGHGSLYNHHDRANSEFRFNFRKKLLIIKSKRFIKAGEEITINYGYDKSQKTKFRIS